MVYLTTCQWELMSGGVDAYNTCMETQLINNEKFFWVMMIGFGLATLICLALIMKAR